MLNRQFIKKVLTSSLLVVAWLGFVFVSAFYGWWMSPIAEPDAVDDFFQRAVETIEAQNTGGNTGLVLIEDGVLVNEYYYSTRNQVGADTVFSTASMSKWIATLGIMKLVEEGRVKLDDPVSQYLTRWNLPAGEYDNSQVTVRRLLSHTAGLTDGLGFGDYEGTESLPTLEESLARPRASSDKEIEIAVTVAPGSQWKYSGGGFLILELLVEEITSLTFEQYMQEAVFAPLGMTRSSYDYLSTIQNTAGSYDAQGRPAPVYQYASSAATAFSTSTHDLSTLVLSLITDAPESSLLTSKSVEAMRTPHGRRLGADVWGLGTMLYAPTPDNDFVYGHDGGNEPAINSTVRINPDTRDAIIVLETGHPSLATQTGSAWVLWQTGIPDVLDVASVLDSMVTPAISGCLLIILAMILSGFISRRRQKSTLG